MNLIIPLILTITSLAGILSWNTTHAFTALNQYGQEVLMWGSGIYARDSYFKTPIFIGTDIGVLFVLVPLIVYRLFQKRKEDTNLNRLKLMSLYATAAYYAASLAFGVTYNRLALVYIILFSLSLFAMFYYGMGLKVRSATITKGMKVFLVLSGIALFAAWLPDMIPTIMNGTTLPLIEVYTTEITYVLDMGIICPLCFIGFYLMQKKNPLGTIVVFAMMQLCCIIGVTMVTQSVCLFKAEIDLPLPMLITKSVSFLILAGAALYFQRNIYRELSE